jgi:two-component sensor histidine kinase
MTTLEIAHALRANRERLRDHLWIREGAEAEAAEESDGEALLDALCADDRSAALARFEGEARRLAERDAALAPRVAHVHRCVEALARGLAEVFAGDPPANAAAQEQLAHVVAAVDAALVRGFDAAAARRADEDAARARGRAARLRALQRVNAATNSALDLNETLQIAAEAVAEVMGADLCSIFLFDDITRELQLRATNGPRPRGGAHFTLLLGEGYTGWVAEHGTPLLARDANADPRYARESGAYPVTYRALLSMPIIFFTVEKLVGVISVQAVEPREFTVEDRGFLEVVAGQLAMNIENGRLYEQTDETLRRKVHELSTLHRVSALVASTLELESVLQIIVMQAVQLSGADRSIIFELDGAAQHLRPVAAHGLGSEFLQRPGVAVGACCAGRAVQTGEPSLCLDCVRSDEGCFFRGSPEAVEDVHAALCVPLVSTHGAQGALCVFSAQRYLFSPAQLQLVVTFANVAAMAMENARLYEQTREGLETKGLLLREMPHRVKNNLQQVASILNMQRRRAKSPDVEQILAESERRIQGIAATHDLLSRQQLGMASVDAIARRIVGIIQGNFVPPELRLAVHVEPCQALVTGDQATTLAIVLNELVANAIEHGFEGRTQGNVRISAERGDDDIVVRVADDGAGPPPGFDLAGSEGLGLWLVRSLATSDLHGSFTLRRATDPDPALAPGTGGEWTVAELTFRALLLADSAAEAATEAVDIAPA